MTNKKSITAILLSSSALISYLCSTSTVLAEESPLGIINDEANLQTGAGLSNAFTNGSTLEFRNVSRVKVNINNAFIRAVNINGVDAATMEFTQDSFFGAVINENAGKIGDKKLSINIDNSIVTLNGTGSDLVGFVSKASLARSNDYSALGDINFIGDKPTLTTIASTILNGAFGGDGIGRANLNVNSFLTATHESVAKIATINIFDNSHLNIDASRSVAPIELANGTTINLRGENAKLQLSHSDNAHDHIFVLKSNLESNVDDQGIIKLSSNALGKKLIINSAAVEGLGVNHRLNKLIISGIGNTDVNVEARAQTIEINSTGNVNFAKKVNSGESSSLQFRRAANVIFNDDTNINNISFASSDGSIIVGKGKTLTSNITAANVEIGTVEFLGEGELAGQVSNLKLLKASGSGDLKLASGTHNIKEIKANALKKLILPDNFNLIGNIDSVGYDSAFDIEFQGSGKIKGDVVARDINIIGQSKFVEFESTVKSRNINIGNRSTLKLNGDVILNKIIAHEATIQIKNDLKFKGNIEGRNTTIDLGSNKVTLNGSAVFSGNTAFNVMYDSVKQDIGCFIVDGASSNLNLADSSVVVNMTSLATLSEVAGKQYPLLLASNGATITPSSSVTVTSNDTNSNVIWEYDPQTHSLVAKDRLEKTVGSPKENSQSMTTGRHTEAIYKAVSYARKSTLKRLAYITSFQTISLASLEAEDNIISGVSAGSEESDPFGVWGSVVYYSSHQKPVGGSAGYRNHSFGKAVGVDKMISDGLSLGASFTYFNTKIKDKAPSINSSKVDTSMLSLYGSYWLSNNFFVQGLLSFSFNDVGMHRIDSGSMESLRGHYKSYSYETEALGGYNYTLSKNATLTPMFGARYTAYQDPSYTETAINSSKISVAKKSSDKIEAIAGAKLTTMRMLDNGMMIIPEIHGFVNQRIGGKAFKINATAGDSAPVLTNTTENYTKTVWSGGVILSLKHCAIEYSVGYDTHISKKYVGHQGTFKILVKI